MTDREAEWVLVPREPTEAMALAGAHTNSEWLNDDAPIGELRYKEPALAVWRTMLRTALGEDPNYGWKTSAKSSLVAASPPAPISDEIVERAALRELSAAIEDLAPHFETPLTLERIPKWKRLDAAQKRAKDMLATLPAPVSPPASPVGAVEALARRVLDLQSVQPTQPEPWTDEYIDACCEAAPVLAAALRSTPSPTREEVARVIEEHVEVERRDSVDLETHQVVRVNVLHNIPEAADAILSLFGRAG